jgi:hypothetical protein
MDAGQIFFAYAASLPLATGAASAAGLTPGFLRAGAIIMII